MARKFLTAIDLAKNELQNGVVQNLASAPGSPVKGQIYFDSTGNILYWWNGTVWVSASGGAGVSYGAITAETAFGAAKTDGVSTNVARADHGHGNPTHVNADHTAINLNFLALPTGDVPMGGMRLTGLGTPVSGGDATNKNYVDNLVTGLSWKDSVRSATTANINLLNAATIDGVAVTTPGERCLVKNQTAPAENGIYYSTAGSGSPWLRAADADTNTEILGASVYVEEGTINADTAWVMTTNAPIVLNTTALTWAQFAGGGAVTAGAGMTQSGNVLNVIGDSTVTVGADVLGVADNGVSNTKLADMAQATIKGRSAGAGDPEDLTPTQVASILSAVMPGKYVLGTVGGATSQLITHGLNTKNVIVGVFRNAGPGDDVECDVEHTSAAQITLRFAVAPAANEYTCVVMG